MTKRLFLKEDPYNAGFGKYVFLEEEEVIEIVGGDCNYIFYNDEEGYFLLDNDEIIEYTSDLMWMEIRNISGVIEVVEFENYIDSDASIIQYEGKYYAIRNDKHGYIDIPDLVEVLNDYEIEGLKHRMYLAGDGGDYGAGFYDEQGNIHTIECNCNWIWEELEAFDLFEEVDRIDYRDGYNTVYELNDERLTLHFSYFKPEFNNYTLERI